MMGSFESKEQGFIVNHSILKERFPGKIHQKVYRDTTFERCSSFFSRVTVVAPRAEKGGKMDLETAIEAFNESSQPQIDRQATRDGRVTAVLPRVGREIIVRGSITGTVEVKAEDVAWLCEEARRAFAPGWHCSRLRLGRLASSIVYSLCLAPSEAHTLVYDRSKRLFRPPFPETRSPGHPKRKRRAQRAKSRPAARRKGRRTGRMFLGARGP